MPAELSRTKLDDKVRQYEQFLNDVLKEDLRKCNIQRAKVQAELKEYHELEQNLKLLQEAPSKELKTQVDLGAEVLCQARVPDTSRVFLGIGLGFHVETDLSDAPRVIGIRTAALKQKEADSLLQAGKIRAHIKLVEGALAELQKL
mmetsp:Transcript_21076/g.53568  ORF Transcript_21076/g.53568 Transcript_21076/m.53568 type:complete len:146 (+) Transcript_21076:94-531(+)